MFERMLNRKNESEEARMEEDRKKAQALRDAKEAENMLKSLEATAGRVLTKEEIEAGLKKAREGQERKDHYPDRPSSKMDRAA